MPSPEQKNGIIRDVVLQADPKTRYDLYFTDRRVAIAAMGKASRSEADSLEVISVLPPAFGVPAPLPSKKMETTEKIEVDEEISKIDLDDLLKLSKKSCFYTYDEIREVRLIFGRKPRFEIYGEECESKFSPNGEQVEEIFELTTSVEALRNKLAVAGKWNTLQHIFKIQLGKNQL